MSNTITVTKVNVMNDIENNRMEGNTIPSPSQKTIHEQLAAQDFMKAYFSNGEHLSSLYYYDNTHATTIERFRNLMFSVNVSVAFLLTYIGDMSQSFIVLYIILLTDALMAFIVTYKQHYRKITSIWKSILETIRAFEWNRFFHGTILKSIIFSLLLLIFYMISKMVKYEVIYQTVLLIILTSETKSLDKHLYRLFNISLYEKITAALLKGPLSFMNVNTNNTKKDNEVVANDDNNNKS